MAEAALPILLGGAASALGNYFGAQTAANAAKQSAALQQQRFNEAVGLQQPFVQAGQNALNLYNNATGVNGSGAQQAYYNSFQNDPGFQARDVSSRQRSQPQNALLPNRAPAALPPAVHNQLLRSAIGHAAVLSDTPEKWAATIDLLKQHGGGPRRL